MPSAFLGQVVRSSIRSAADRDRERSLGVPSQDGRASRNGGRPSAKSRSCSWLRRRHP